MRRFFVEIPLASEISENQKLIITGQDAHHISRVLRLTAGDGLLLVGADGMVGQATIDLVDSKGVTVSINCLEADDHEAPIQLTIVQGLPKADKLDFIVQKAVELGVSVIQPLSADHSVVHYDKAKAAQKVGRWQKIALEAAKQCGRGIVPDLAPIRSLAEIIADIPPHTLCIMLYEAESNITLKQVLRTNQGYQKIILFIGPEGGFSQQEVNLCRSKNIQTVTLGPRILRTETAAVAAVAAVMYECGDLGG